MSFCLFSRSNKQGFTLVESLVGLGVLGIFFTIFALTIQQILINVASSRIRSVAHTLAQSKMELVRNLPYEDIGTIGGIPPGSIQETESVTINNQAFEVHTSVIYIDDPFDGTVPTDLINTDYKRVRVEINWGGIYPSRVPVTFVTNIAPKGVESIVGGGTLLVQVFNAQGNPISNATVHIDNTSVTPQVHLQTLTNANGLVVIPGAPACTTCYQIRATKAGYSTDKTYSTNEVANPLQPHATVLEGKLTQLSFAIDQVSTIIVNSLGSRASGFPPISNVFFTVRGSKIIGYTTSDDPVHKYTSLQNTGGGTVSVSGLEWDTYTLDFSSSAHVLAGSNPFIPVPLLPATNTTIAISALPKGNTSLLVAVKNNSNEPQASASVQLSNQTLTYDVSNTTGSTGSADYGQTFFGNVPLGNLNLKINAAGYQEATSSVTIATNQMETVTLIPQ